MSKRYNRKRGYLEAIIVIVIFTLTIFIFDLPKAISFFILGVSVVSNTLIFEFFIYKKGKTAKKHGTIGYGR